MNLRHSQKTWWAERRVAEKLVPVESVGVSSLELLDYIFCSDIILPKLKVAKNVNQNTRILTFIYQHDTHYKESIFSLVEIPPPVGVCFVNGVVAKKADLTPNLGSAAYSPMNSLRISPLLLK